MSKIGEKGGKSKSPKKIAASLRNLQIANENRRRKLKDLTPEETRKE